MIDNDLMKGLLNSDDEESRALGALLLSSEHIPEEEREPYIMELIEKFLNGKDLGRDMFRNLIVAYNGLSKNKTIKNRITRL